MALFQLIDGLKWLIDMSVHGHLYYFLLINDMFVFVWISLTVRTLVALCCVEVLQATRNKPDHLQKKHILGNLRNLKTQMYGSRVLQDF